jgi:hypothetical protein
MIYNIYMVIWINTYFSTIFNGMNIHLPAILMWTTGVQGFDTLPHFLKLKGLKVSDQTRSCTNIMKYHKIKEDYNEENEDQKAYN